MAAINHTDPSELLGKNVLVTEIVYGVRIETRGRVTGVLKMVPDSRLTPSVFIETTGKPDGDFFDLQEITLTVE